MASESASEDALRAALAQFAARPDLTDDARNKLALILTGSCEGFGVTDEGRLALKPKALAAMLGEQPSTLKNWRAKHVGPPWVAVRHKNQLRILYPVIGVRRWLSEFAFEGSFHPDPSVLAAFGLTPVEQEEQVAA